jgi:hypothetical protein
MTTAHEANGDASMSKKKAADSKTGDRQTIQVTAEWNRALLTLAGKKGQPKVWTIYRLVGEACDAEGIEHPPFPWEAQT